VFFACDQEDKAAKLAGAARLKIGNELGLTKKDVFEFCWIVDFPMYEWNEDERRSTFRTNPFSMPNVDPEAFIGLDPAGREKQSSASRLFNMTSSAMAWSFRPVRSGTIARTL